MAAQSRQSQQSQLPDAAPDISDETSDGEGDVSRGILPEALERDINVAILKSMQSTPGQLPSYMRTASAREAFQAAFETVGGMPRLAIWAHNNYGRFLQLYSRLIPVALIGDPKQPITVIAPWLTGRRLSGGESPPTLPGDPTAERVPDDPP